MDGVEKPASSGAMRAARALSAGLVKVSMRDGASPLIPESRLSELAIIIDERSGLAAARVALDKAPVVLESCLLAMRHTGSCRARDKTFRGVITNQEGCDCTIKRVHGLLKEVRAALALIDKGVGDGALH